MDANEIDVHEATVRRELGKELENREAGLSVPADRDIEEARTVISSPTSSSVPSQPTSGGSPAEVARVLLGHHLDHFALEMMIGGGGMGAVFRARDTRLDRTVAIKVIPRVGDDAELQRRFRNEAQSAARLDHPNIARVYDVGQQGGWHYIVFEYIDGINLRDLVYRDGVLSVDDAVYYTRQVAEALDHAHKRGVVHRDIKPSNVLITTTGQAKLVDMGLARAQQLEMSEDMTASGVTLGTFDYISPEQARDPRDADVRSDIYSLGCTLYFTLTGRAPYPSGTVLQKLLSHGSSPVPDPRRVRKDLSANLVAVLHKMLAKQPADRYRRPLDLISDLYQLAELERLPRSLSAGSIAIAPANRFAKFVEYHLPWVAAFLLLFLSAGWLQILSSVSGDLDLTTVPVVPPVPAAGDLESSNLGAVNSGKSKAAMTGEFGSREPLDSGLGAIQESGVLPSPAVTGERRDDMTAKGENGESSLTDEVNGNDGTPVLRSEVEESVLGAGMFPGTPKVSIAPGLGRPPVPLIGVMSEPDLVTESLAASDETARKANRIVRVRAARYSGAPVVVSDGRLEVETLEEAFAVADRDSQLSVIEVDGVVPISVTLTLPRRGLTMRGVSEDAGLDFGAWSPTETASKSLFDVGSNSLELEDLDLAWRIPSMALGNVSMFRLAGGNTIRLTGCTITIEDSDDRANANAFIYDPDEGTGPSRLVAIQLEDCIVRGGLTVLKMRRAGLLELKWDNGLLCIGGTMVLSGGASSSEEYGGARARIIMADVTAVFGESLVAVELEGATEQPFLVDREANNCVFSSLNEGPLISVRGAAEGLPDERLVVLRGRDNYYDGFGGGGKAIYESATLNGSVNRTELSQLLGMNPPKWVQEQSPQGVVNWSQRPPQSGRLHEAVPSDFLQDGVVLPGFRLGELPKL